ncbi:MAG: restriction endonuclease subunit S [Kiritimatiellae bacterium]|nr:restriction endonuclease subunit S [Kiritimatiellia bacterium]
MKTTKFKMTELGPIPLDWEVKRIIDVAPLQRGFDLPFSHLMEGVVPVVYSNGIGAYHSKGMCKGPGLVTGRSGTIGKFFYIESGDYWPHNTTLWVTDFCGNNPLFVKYLYETLDFEDFSTGTGVPTLNRNSVHEHKVVIPPLAEQRRIAGALSDVDELISALGKLIEKKRNIKTGAMQELLTGKTRLSGFKGKWEEKRLGDCGFCFNGLTGKSGSDFGHGKACYITFLNVLTNVVIDSSIFEPVDICSGENQNEVSRGDIFFNTSSETPEEVGLCAVLEEDVKSVYLNSFCFGFRITDNDVSGRFLAYWFRASAGRALMTSLAQGSTRYNLSKDAFREACVCIPPTLAEQKAIATVLSDIDAEIAALEADQAKYERIKSGMMQELLTGKTRLI